MVCEKFGLAPWEVSQAPAAWLDVCFAYLAWSAEEESKAYEKAKQESRGTPVKKGRPLNDPGEHRRPSRRR